MDSVNISPSGSQTASYVGYPSGSWMASYVGYPSGSPMASYVGYSSGTNIYLLNYINNSDQEIYPGSLTPLPCTLATRPLHHT